AHALWCLRDADVRGIEAVRDRAGSWSARWITAPAYGTAQDFRRRPAGRRYAQMTEHAAPDSGDGGRLDPINRATVAIAAERSLPALLQRIVDAAREVTGARYAALGVIGEGDEPLEFITSGIGEAERARIRPPPRGQGLVAVTRRDPERVRTANIADHPLSGGFPPHHPRMTSFLGAPILLDGRNLGNLYLTDKQGAAEFTEEDERLLVALAA